MNGSVEHESTPFRQDRQERIHMASVSVRVPGQTARDVVAGPYRVASARITVPTAERVELHNLTARARDFVRGAGVEAGQLVLASMHTTSALFINEWQDALLFDIRAHMESLVSQGAYYRHNDPKWSDCDRSNADSHLRTLVLGTHLVLPVVDGDLVLGEWQSVILGELDGPRERTIHLQAMGVGYATPTKEAQNGNHPDREG
jgi:secondary thiamine-phosphate synthase enzyme